MQFRSIADLNRDVLAGLGTLPRDIDVVVGIPRSGMLPATLIALALNLPLAELESFADGRLLGVGKTRRAASTDRGFDDVNHVLVVDDSVHEGNAMRDARRRMEPLKDRFRITYCAIYGAARSPAVDFVFESVPHPRVFEWNVMHHSILERACVDIDGVLCSDPSASENDDGAAYLSFLRNARPRFIPTHRIGELVTSRLEKYRAETEEWLAGQGVRFGRLVMLDLPSGEERRRLGAHAEFKGNHYRGSKAELFIESELRQAVEIARLSGKPVLSMEGPVMCEPADPSPLAIAERVRFRTRRGRTALLRMLRSLLGPNAFAALKQRVRNRA